jgi:UDP-N-acetylglucosamine transferase subunit ALG13
MIFLTIGTQFPFDRLVEAIDSLVGENDSGEEVFAQIGESSYEPHSFEYVESLKKSEFDHLMQKASGIIGHAGVGTIAMALEHNKPLLVMPRSAKHREVVNDHQAAIAQKFGQLEHILVAHEVEELPEKIEQLKTFVPRKRKATPEPVVECIAEFLNNLANDGEG